jgi:hypothetical protein
MTMAWALNAIGLFLTSVGALLMFLHLRRTPPLAETASPADVRRAYQNDRRLMTIAVGLIAAWCVLQYLGVFLS